MSISHAILKALSDGAFHSGEELAAANRVTRAAIWKAIKVLQAQYELDIHSVRGRGYRLATSLELLDEQCIRDKMQSSRKLAGLEVFLSIDSTNTYLMQASAASRQLPRAVLAEHQRSGRGRRGRGWHSPFAGNLYLSLAWRFVQPPANMMALGLAFGVVVCKFLADKGVTGLALKWPNDVLCQGKKLSGLLLEMRGESNGPCDVVIGLGLNLGMPASASAVIDQPFISLQEILQPMPSRNQLAAGLLDVMLDTLQEIEMEGLARCLADWNQYDALRDQPVNLCLADRQATGVARGIDAQGALLVEQDGKLQRYHSGEISLRAKA